MSKKSASNTNFSHLGLGSTPEKFVAAVESVAQLLREIVELRDGLYQPRFTLPM